jgi:hypothetical protein
MGNHRRKGYAAAVCDFLENSGRFMANKSAAPEKIFEKSENFVCICGKMGYNKME